MKKEKETTMEETSKLPREVLENARTQAGVSLASMSDEGPVLMVFLRHLGCSFCREAIQDLAGQREEIEKQGVQIVFVYMGSEERAAVLFEKYGMGDVARVRDPERKLYEAFELRHGNVAQLLGPRVWIRGFQAAILEKHGVGSPDGDPLQMPGTFLVSEGEIVRAFRHRTAADRPDYKQMIACELEQD